MELNRPNCWGTDLDILEGYAKSSGDPYPNRILLNDGSGGFTEDTGSTFAAHTEGAVETEQVFVADVDGDNGACKQHRARTLHTCRWRSHALSCRALRLRCV